MSEPTPEFRDAERLDLPSASGMEIVVACPGSVNLKASLPPEAFAQKAEDEDEWAKSGTRIHAAFETGNTLDLDQDEAETYRQGVAYEEEIVKKWLADKVLDGYEEGPREMRVYLHNPLVFGQVIGSVKIDRHYIGLPRSRGLVLLTDLKSGWNPNLPPSPRSWQLRFGAVALQQEEYGDWMKEARVGYCKAQQKCTVNDFCDYGEMDLKYSWDSIRFHLWESSQPDAPLHAGPHCNWCPCKAYCVVAGAYSMMPTVIARRVPRSEMMTWEMMVESMQPADLLKIFENSTIIDKILKAVKDRLKGFTPEALAELGLEKGKGRRMDPIGNLVQALQVLYKHFGESDVLQCCELVKGRLVDLVMKQKNMSKESAGKWVDTTLAAFITTKTSDPPLKRIKETRLI